MSTCFVMQPFDGGKFDKRYEDTFAPAVRGAGVEPYRVDRDPSVSIPIDDIESHIREATVCLADITLDNPNVWFELGFAMASKKEVVLVCSDERTTRFPFDVQHRTIIKYETSSARDFVSLQEKISSKILAYLKKSENLLKLSTLTAPARPDGLEPHADRTPRRTSPDGRFCGEFGS